jgi:hypothetical protein
MPQAPAGVENCYSQQNTATFLYDVIAWEQRARKKAARKSLPVTRQTRPAPRKSARFDDGGVHAVLGPTGWLEDG